jgi:hypothetical protein
MEPDLFTRSVRAHCSICGAGDLEWMTVDGARSVGLPVDEAMRFLGRVESVWRCSGCGEVGFFGPSQVG